jgi:hypothetical protein
MEQRLSLIPLGVSDVSRAQAFYEKLRWHLEGVVDDEGDQSPSSTPPGSSSRLRLGTAAAVSPNARQTPARDEKRESLSASGNSRNKGAGLRVLARPGTYGRLRRQPRLPRFRATHGGNRVHTGSGQISGQTFDRPKPISRKPPICRDKRHRYRDSDPGFRTENPIREASLGRFGHVRPVSSSGVRWSSLESGTYFGTRFSIDIT